MATRNGNPKWQVPLASLTASAYNPRRMEAANLRRLRASIMEHTRALPDWNPDDGARMIAPIVVNRQGLRIVGGHQRVAALKSTGQTWIHADDIRYVDLAPDSAAEKALNVSLNNREAQGEWDEAALEDLLSSIAGEDEQLYADLDLLAVAPDEEPVASAAADPDAAPEAPENPTSRPGQVYRLGEHILVCGDCTDPAIAALALDGAPAGLVFTDPPYNMAYQSKKLGGIMNDAIAESAFIRLILASAAAMQKALRPGGAWYICMSSSAYALVANQLRKLGMDHRLIVWAKNYFGMGAQDYRPRHELILYGVKGRRADRTWNAGRSESDLWELDPDRAVFARETEDGGMIIELGDGADAVRIVLEQKTPGMVLQPDGDVDDVWRYERERGAYVHPTQKPVALVERAIRNSTSRGDTVFDPFGGSGTTLIACERTGRRARIIELDPRYADVIRERWAQYTGATAEPTEEPATA